MTNKYDTPGRILIALLGAGLLGHAQAASIADWEGCSSIPADIERLACYDRVSGRSQPEAGPVPAGDTIAMEPAPPPVAAAPAPEEPQLLSALSRHWELDDEAKQGAFLFRPHRPNYFLPIKYSSSPNNTPFQGTLIQPDLGLDKLETELQLSFKIKGMEGVFGHDNADLWFGYTITSFWQAYNSTHFLAVSRDQLRAGNDAGVSHELRDGRFSRPLHQPGTGCTSRMAAAKGCRAAGTGCTRSSDSSATIWRC